MEKAFENWYAKTYAGKPYELTNTLTDFRLKDALYEAWCEAWIGGHLEACNE